ncbi:Rv3654c family TadE-like protein [Intrasporangium calvum]|uniref:Helicase/secretion neighborhood TadE-like protein n=1 Tax=Intrasporangium calvum (strain ATCC 23552 / DSM 43043 / JCM 3097 / NBRC 12989 / NCIMB 10167 / NRRL B-3866 / 7 KIP) TaxID=710696 RepID=E6S993_INTC7|nr:Rv3654c family TadE-like protein [Intrasporangium calvum]ADU47069.1 hypothetical protein Intca_0524 [Intrasporangium calvum DSM 43043]AXG12338.1 pilus assembly protein TadE [Intrasporangium calvum]
MTQGPCRCRGRRGGSGFRRSAAEGPRPRVLNLSRQPATERGAATVLVIGVLVALLVVTTGGLLIASAVVASHRARLAADLAVLAGATALRDASTVERACAAARRVATLNGAELGACQARGTELELTVTVAAPPWSEPARARSRAGPATEALR